MTRRLPFLAALIAMTFFAVHASEAAEPKKGLRAGAAKVDFTPKRGVSLDGPISKNGPVVGVNDPLHARAVVLDDGKTRLAIVICDACIIGRDVIRRGKGSRSANHRAAGRPHADGRHAYARRRASGPHRQGAAR